MNNINYKGVKEMAKITIEELSESLKEYLNGLGLTEAQVQELIDKFEDEKIGDISQLSTEEKGSLVGAINEIENDEKLFRNMHIPSITDLNDLKTNGVYFTTSGMGLLNLPPMLGGNYGLVVCLTTYNNNRVYNCIQYYHHYNGASNGHYSTYCRMYSSTDDTWSEWSSYGGTRVINYKDIDANNLVNTGSYYIASGMTNGPESYTGALYMEVISRSTTYVYQRCTINVNTNEYLPKFERTCFNGTWTAWRYL